MRIMKYLFLNNIVLKIIFFDRVRMSGGRCYVFWNKGWNFKDIFFDKLIYIFFYI